MSNILQFQATYSRMVARELGLDDAGLTALLAGTSLTPQHLFQLDQQISATDQYLIIRNGLRLSGNPAFGLQLGSRLPVTSHGTLGVAMSTGANLRECFKAIARFQSLRAQFVRVSYHDEGEHFRIAMQL